MMQYSSTQASKKGGQMLEHWGHLCETYEGTGAANLYFDRKSWMEHFNSHPEIYCITFTSKRKLSRIYDIVLTKITNCCILGIVKLQLLEIAKSMKRKLNQNNL